MSDHKKIFPELKELKAKAWKLYVAHPDEHIREMALCLHVTCQAFEEYIHGHNGLHATMLEESRANRQCHADTRRRLGMIADHLELPEAHPRNSK